jgi:hypothetical protein
MEDILANAEPATQAHAGAIGEGPARRVHAHSGRLAGNAKARGAGGLDDRSRLVRQGTAVARGVAANAAAPKLLEQRLERVI